jgi:hypothetical protein
VEELAAKPFPPALWEDLERLDPQSVAAQSQARLLQEAEDPAYVLTFLGGPYRVQPKERLVIAPPGHARPGFQKTLCLLSYLIGAGSGPAPGLAGRVLSPMEIPGGAMFFRGPHELSTQSLTRVFGNDPEALARKALSRGAENFPGAAFRWRILPSVDIYCYLEPEDDEFPSRASWAFDAHAHYYMPLDALWGLINVAEAELAGTAPQGE